MGTEIVLSLGGLDLAYSKNSIGLDHGFLFQEEDRKRVHGTQIDYDYFKGQDDAELAAMEAAFTCPLRDVVPRLDLLGFSLPRVESDYQVAVRTWREEYYGDGEPPEPMSFEEFRAFALSHDIASLDNTFVDDLDETRVKGRFAGYANINRITTSMLENGNAYSERSFFGDLISFMHPYGALRLLAENPANLDQDLTWQYGPLVDSGWASVEEFNAGARRSQRFLIATEGSSDVHILRHAFSLLRPGVADFFHFIDVSEGHPFSGTGSLRKFAEGLAKIDVQNLTIFVFDNDAEGVEARQKVEALNLPPNMGSIVLPDVEGLRSFPVLGPDSVQNSDINGRAAAIECYLDLNVPGRAPAQATWSNYKKELNRWQGALDYKESYVERFLALRPDTSPGSDYDTSKIAAVLDAIIAKAGELAFAHHYNSQQLA